MKGRIDSTLFSFPVRNEIRKDQYKRNPLGNDSSFSDLVNSFSSSLKDKEFTQGEIYSYQAINSQDKNQNPKDQYLRDKKQEETKNNKRIDTTEVDKKDNQLNKSNEEEYNQNTAKQSIEREEKSKKDLIKNKLNQENFNSLKLASKNKLIKKSDETKSILEDKKSILKPKEIEIKENILIAEDNIKKLSIDSTNEMSNYVFGKNKKIQLQTKNQAKKNLESVQINESISHHIKLEKNSDTIIKKDKSNKKNKSVKETNNQVFITNNSGKNSQELEQNIQTSQNNNFQNQNEKTGIYKKITDLSKAEIVSRETMDTEITNGSNIKEILNKRVYGKTNTDNISKEILHRQFDQLIQRAKVQIKNSQNASLQTNLYPKELGRVSVQISMIEGAIHTRFSVENEIVQKELQQRWQHISESLIQDGIAVESFEVNVQSEKNYETKHNQKVRLKTENPKNIHKQIENELMKNQLLTKKNEVTYA